MPGDVEWELGAMNKVLYGAVTAGDLDEARAVAAGQGGLADRLGQPLFRVLTLQAAALLAMGEGRFADAEALAEEADGLGVFLSGSDAAGGYGVQLFGIRREQGRLDEARPLVEAVARLDRVGATWRPALTVLQAELGLHEDAAAGLAVLVADGLAAVPRDSLWWASLSYLADAAVALGDRDAAAVVYGELVRGAGPGRPGRQPARRLRLGRPPARRAVRRARAAPRRRGPLRDRPARGPAGRHAGVAGPHPPGLRPLPGAAAPAGGPGAGRLDAARGA